MPQRRISHPLAQDVDRARELHPQAFRGVNHIAPNRPIAGIHVNGDDLSVVGIFDLPTNVSFVYLLAQAGDLRYRAGWRIHRKTPVLASFGDSHSTPPGNAPTNRIANLTHRY